MRLALSEPRSEERRVGKEWGWVAGGVRVPRREDVPGLALVEMPVPTVRGAQPLSLSDSVAVQVEAEFTGTEDGEQLTVVPEVRLVPVTVSVPEETVWSVSPE